MVQVIALGNPGHEYEMTRHNIGWLIVSFAMRAWEIENGTYDKYSRSIVSRGKVGNETVEFIFPQTFMNESGHVIPFLLKEMGRLIVVHDDVDIPFGTIRVSKNKGSGGHNGVASIIHALKTTEFTRLRMGIGITKNEGNRIRPRGDALSSFVLSSFQGEEKEKFPMIFEEATRVLKEVITGARNK